MIRLNTLFIAIILIISPQLKSFAQNHPSSFADLAEKLMPSVVNISTTTMVKTQTNPFPFHLSQVGALQYLIMDQLPKL